MTNKELIHQGGSGLPPAMESKVKIKPIADVLNSTGLVQIIGGTDGGRILVEAPGIYFYSSLETAQMLERCLHEIRIDKNIKLNYRWSISGHFNDSFEFVFKLHVPSLNYLADSCGTFEMIKWMVSMHRKKDQDLKILSRHLPRMLLQFRDDNQP